MARFSKTGPNGWEINAGRIGLYAFLLTAAAFFALPLVIMIC